MKKKIGIAVLLAGLTLVGVGSYEGFEIYDKYLKSEKIDGSSLYTGIYKSIDSNIKVISATDDKVVISLNDMPYEFKLKGDFFENDLLNFKIKMMNEKITLFSEGDEEIFYKEK